MGGRVNEKSFKSVEVVRRRRQSSNRLAMAIPGQRCAEQTFVGGFLTSLQIYNYVVTARILLSWFPQSQGVALLQPVFTLSDPFLNTFRGLIPAIGGFDLSPILGFVLLNVLTNATVAIGCETNPCDRKAKTL